ncbi:hypothetical protein PflQ8_5655 [Pseudomonas fluorescens Q8r1-96]|nr:hypothetical protein PflQ8_5655 [Pseudomonas fluorescens Q8r1-96]
MRVGFGLRRLGLFFRGLAVIRQVQRTFLTTGCHEAGNRDERSKGRDQALHGEILENALIAPEYTGHPSACLCNGAPVRRRWWSSVGISFAIAGKRPYLAALEHEQTFSRLPQ